MELNESRPIGAPVIGHESEQKANLGGTAVIMPSLYGRFFIWNRKGSVSIWDVSRR